jgi:proteic killer suppression protein
VSRPRQRRVQRGKPWRVQAVPQNRATGVTIIGSDPARAGIAARRCSKESGALDGVAHFTGVTSVACCSMRLRRSVHNVRPSFWRARFRTMPLRASVTSVMLRATLPEVRIRNVDKGLKRLYTEDNPKGLPADAVGKIHKMMAFLQDMEGADELRSILAWKAHQMSGDRKGTWSLYVTRNWRLTFTVDAAENEILDVNYEDDH